MPSTVFPESLVRVLAFDDAKVDITELSKYVRRFSTDSILKMIQQETASMISNGEYEKSVNFQLIGPGRALARQFLVLPWRLIDFAYFCMVNSEEQSSLCPTDQEFYFLYYCILRYYRAKESISEKKAHIWLPSVVEMERFFPDKTARIAPATAYAFAQRHITYQTMPVCALRSTGNSTGSHACVNIYGSVFEVQRNDLYSAIRPMVRVRFD